MINYRYRHVHYDAKQRAVSLRQLIFFCCAVCELQMMVGNAKYQCSCVRYVPDHTTLIIALSVGIGLLLIICIISLIIFLYRRRQSKLVMQGKVSGDNYVTSLEQDDEDKQYNRQLPDEYIRDTEL